MRWRGPSMVRLAPTLDPKTLALKCFKPRTSRRASQARHDLRGCPAPRLEVGERPAHALLEWSIGCGLAQRGRAPCFVGAESEQAQRPDHLLGGGPCLGLAPPGFRLAPRRLALLPHELGPERALRSVLVVRPAAQPDPRHAGPAPARHRLDVIKLEPRARRAAAPVLAHERA